MHQGALPTPMLKQESGLLRGGWSRPCDACRASASAVFCRTDALYLCSACDSHAHHFPADASAHERVLVCEACEQAPAVFACKADAAALCVSCDMEIHSTPLASRHTRVLVLPITDDVPVRFGNCMFPTDGTGQKGQEVTWPFIDYQECGDRNFVEFLDCNMDVGESKPTSLHPLPQEDDCVYGYDRLELLLNHSGGQYEGDRHVPSPGGLTREWEEGRSLDVGLELGMIPKVEFMEHYNFYPLSPSYSREPYMVPDAATATESSKSDTTPSKGTLDLFEQPIDRTAAAVDRQARLLRYREKKKKRNFEKTIRYASRKAYAEVRPRVKGRFAKIVMDSEPAMDRMLHATYSAELTYEYTYGYGVVPSY